MTDEVYPVQTKAQFHHVTDDELKLLGYNPRIGNGTGIVWQLSSLLPADNDDIEWTLQTKSAVYQCCFFSIAGSITSIA